MSALYGIREDERTTTRAYFTVWSGPFLSTFEAEGWTRYGAKSATLTDYSGERFRVELPEGVTFPRTAENYRHIDDAISAAYETHNARLGRVQIGANA